MGDNSNHKLEQIEPSHESQMLTLYFSANHGYVKFLRFIDIISTFLQFMSHYVQITCIFVEGGGGDVTSIRQTAGPLFASPLQLTKNGQFFGPLGHLVTEFAANVFNKLLGHIPAELVATKPGKPKHDLFQTFAK